MKFWKFICFCALITNIGLMFTILIYNSTIWLGPRPDVMFTLLGVQAISLILIILGSWRQSVLEDQEYFGD